MTQNVCKEQDKEKKWLTYSGPHIVVDQGINLLVAHFEHFFVLTTRSKPHTKSSSAVDYMNRPT